MSSTGRSDARKGHEFDYYHTPEWIIEEFFGATTKIVANRLSIYTLIEEMEEKFTEHGMLDPCAGGQFFDGEASMAYPAFMRGNGRMYIQPTDGAEPVIHTMDIREDSPAEIHGDFLNTDLDRKYGVVISNPPFTLAQEFVTKALECTVDNGYVVMLLRIGFFGSAKREKWFKAHMPEFTILHHKRPSFSNDGKTDSDYYAHFVWRKGYHPTESRLILV